jgi:hypothetical protein
VKRGTAFAYTEGETPLSHQLIKEVITQDELPFALVLKKVTRGKEGLVISSDLSGLDHLWVDYQPNNLAWPLMSERMRNVVEAHLTGEEGVAWLTATVTGNQESRKYFIPRFQQKLDVLNERHTTFVAGTSHVVKPVFSRSKVRKHSLFFVPQTFWQITSGLYVSGALKKALQQQKLTGIGFESTSLA